MVRKQGYYKVSKSRNVVLVPTYTGDVIDTSGISHQMDGEDVEVK